VALTSVGYVRVAVAAAGAVARKASIRLPAVAILALAKAHCPKLSSGADKPCLTAAHSRTGSCHHVICAGQM
jgi:hypothetical protein